MARTGASKGTRFPRLVLLALVLTVLILAVNSIAANSSDRPDVVLAYLDRVRPTVDDSTRQGMAFDDFRTRAPELGANGLSRSLERIGRETGRSRRQIHEVKPPPALREGHALLLAALTARAGAVASMAEALGGSLERLPADQVVQQLTDVGLDLRLSDRAYELFVLSLPQPIRKLAPSSRWVGGDDVWSRAHMAAFVSTMRSSLSPARVHDVAIVTFTTEPAAVAMEGPNPVLPTARSVRLHVVVANVGNEAQKRVAVEASVTSVGGMDTARQFVDLGAGERQTVTLTVRPAPVGTVTLLLRAVAVAGETNIADNERSWAFVMR